MTDIIQIVSVFTYVLFFFLKKNVCSVVLWQLIPCIDSWKHQWGDIYGLKAHYRNFLQVGCQESNGHAHWPWWADMGSSVWNSERVVRLQRNLSVLVQIPISTPGTFLSVISLSTWVPSWYVFVQDGGQKCEQAVQGNEEPWTMV